MKAVDGHSGRSIRGDNPRGFVASRQLRGCGILKVPAKRWKSLHDVDLANRTTGPNPLRMEQRAEMLPPSMPAKAAPFAVTGLRRRLGSIDALDAVSFALRPGEVVGLIGPNGSGKTTLLECLAGLQPADAGSIAHGFTTTTSPATYYLPDGITPWEHRPVAWTLRFFTALHDAAADRAGALADALDLGAVLSRPIGELSRGQRKRALIALALLTRAALLLIDEPFEGLDLRQTARVASALRADAAAGRSLLLSIHQLADAPRVCDRMILLHDGAVVGDGTLDQLRGAVQQPGATLEQIFLALT
jgi:ABC-2 type transport system ATP-binding protein